MGIVSMKSLLEAGAHFGHQTKRWNPKMREYIFTSRNGIHIIDLRQTVEKIEEAYNFVQQRVARGGKILFVGTKKQAQDIVKEEATRCGMFYVNQRWFGGSLTNFKTFRLRVEKLNSLERDFESGQLQKLPLKEFAKFKKEKERLQFFLEGIRKMEEVPQIMFIADTHEDKLAILEARRLRIPSISIVDTNSDPTGISIPIPGNDDAIRSIRLFTGMIADAVIEGLEGYQVASNEKKEEIFPDEPEAEKIKEIEENEPVVSLDDNIDSSKIIEEALKFDYNNVESKEVTQDE